MPTTKAFFYILSLTLGMSLSPLVFFSICALTISKFLLQRYFLLYFCPNPNQMPKGCCLFLQNPYHTPATKGFFLYFPYRKKGHPKMCFLYFTLTLAKCLPQRLCCFFSIFALTLNKGLPQKGAYLYVCLNPNQGPPTKCAFLHFALTLNIGLHQKVFFYVCFNQNQRPTTIFFLSILALILTKGLPQRLFFSIFVRTLAIGKP